MNPSPVQPIINHPLYTRVEAALESIRPYLIADGGNVRVHHITEDLTLQLQLEGNCGTCPMSAMTLKAGVEDAVKSAVPEITAVVAVNPQPEPSPEEENSSLL